MLGYLSLKMQLIPRFFLFVNTPYLQGEGLETCVISN